MSEMVRHFTHNLHKVVVTHPADIKEDSLLADSGGISGHRQRLVQSRCHFLLRTSEIQALPVFNSCVQYVTLTGELAVWISRVLQGQKTHDSRLMTPTASRPFSIRDIFLSIPTIIFNINVSVCAFKFLLLI